MSKATRQPGGFRSFPSVGPTRRAGTIALRAGGGIILCALASCARFVPYSEVVAGVPRERFVDVNGRSVHVLEAGTGESTIVLLHGFASSSHSFAGVMPRLAVGHRVLAPDLAGFGLTERPRDAASCSPAGQADLVLGVMDAKRVDRAHLVGHSYGGTLALYLAERHPERVSSVVVAGAPLKFGPPLEMLRHPVAVSVATPLARWLVSSPAAFNHALGVAYHAKDRPSRAESEEYRRLLLVEGFDFAFRAHTEIDGRAPENLIDPARIDRPLLALWGERDGIVRPGTGRRIAAAAEHGRFHLLGRTGHASVEESPAAFAQAVLAFIEAEDSDPTPSAAGP